MIGILAKSKEYHNAICIFNNQRGRRLSAVVVWWRQVVATTHRQDGARVAPQAGAALAHFGRDGKGGDTCFGNFFPFFAPMSPDFAHGVTCF